MLVLLLQSIAGNLMTASPISDLNPFYMAAGVKVKLVSAGMSTLLLVFKFTFEISN